MEKQFAISRFIPTGVGNIHAGNGGVSGCAVHPHGRGEHAGIGYRDGARFGSSPRAWGTWGVGTGSAGVGRFIPTGVGNITGKSASRPRASVHPHGRGEHGHGADIVVADSGSSPRAWGTSFLVRPFCIAERFIPTGVGNMRVSGIGTGRDSVHPHGRGEHSETKARYIDMGGSSPRAWGTYFQQNDAGTVCYISSKNLPVNPPRFRAGISPRKNRRIRRVRGGFGLR